MPAMSVCYRILKLQHVCYVTTWPIKCFNRLGRKVTTVFQRYFVAVYAMVQMHFTSPMVLHVLSWWGFRKFVLENGGRLRTVFGTGRPPPEALHDQLALASLLRTPSSCRDLQRPPFSLRRRFY